MGVKQLKKVVDDLRLEAIATEFQVNKHKAALQVLETRYREIKGSIWGGTDGALRRAEAAYARAAMTEEDDDKPTIVWKNNKPWRANEETRYVIHKETAKRIYYRRAGDADVEFTEKENVDLDASGWATPQYETNDS